MTTEATLLDETKSELATILVALRNWQLTLSNLCIAENNGKALLAAVSENYSEYAGYFRACQPLTIDEIDTLCEKLSGPRDREQEPRL
jgi:hypothetical protein